MNASGAARRQQRRVLVADDSATYRAVAARVLADAGYEVAEAADGAAALKLLQEGRPVDLVVLELNLPRLRGIDLVRRAREEPRLARLPFLVVSDAVTEHLRRVLADLGIEAFLSKNHALRELLYQADALLFASEGEQRRGPRRLASLPVNFWVGETLYLQACFDLSEVGMFVVVADDPPPPTGTRLHLRFWLPTADRLVVCEGEVVWRNTAPGDLRITHPPGMGVRFTRIDAADLALVREYVRRAG